MKKQRIYICGKISGMEWNSARPRFEDAENKLNMLGYEAVNPIKLCYPETDWEKCMCKDFEALLSCDGIYVMDNWKESKGARIEVAIAKELGLKIIKH
jgi:hypothetical protein